MVLQRWNFEKHEYEPFKVPDNRKIRLHCNSMTEVIDCAICGKHIRYGASYTSAAVHDYLGFGYAICRQCHTEEFEKRLKF